MMGQTFLYVMASWERQGIRVSKCLLSTCFLLSLSFIIILPASAKALVKNEKTWNILVLHSYHKGLSWTDSLVRGIDEGFSGPGLTLNISHEFMDTKRLFTEDYLNQLDALYRLKFKNNDIDVVLSTDDHAFNFLRLHHDTFFPGKPIVFSGVNTFNKEMLEDYPTFTGVVEAFDIPSTLDIALRLHPKATRFVVINDQTLTGKSNIELFQKAMKTIARPMELLLLDNHTMAEVQDEVSRLDEKDIIVWLTFTADREGNYFSFRQSARMISGASKAPLYSFWDFHLGYGIVGGRLASGYFQGRKAAELALKILGGEPVGDIPVVTDSPNRYMFDFVQLERFNIDQKLLPPDSVVINRPLNFYSHYKVIVWGILAGFLALSLIIMLLLVNNSSRRSANIEITLTKNRFKRIFDDASVVLFEAEFNDFYEELEKLKNTGIAHLHSYFARQPEELQRVAKLVQMQDCNRAALTLYGAASREELFLAIEDGLSVLSIDGFNKIIEAIESDVPQLEWETVNLRLNGEQMHVLISMKLAGASGDSRAIIISVVDVTERKRYIEELRMSENRFRTLFDSAASGIAMLDLDGNFLRVNEACCSMFGYSRQELEQKNWRDITHSDDIHVTRSLITDLLEGKPIGSLEKRYIHKDGRIVWTLLNVGLNIDHAGKPLNYVTQMQDITQIKIVQAQMHLKDERYRQLFEADLSGFYIAEPGGKVLLCNQVFAGVLGYSTVAEVVGQNVAPYYRNSEFWSRLVEDLRQRKKIESNEVELLRSDGRSLSILFNAIGRFDGNGQLLEIQGHMINISRLKKLETQLVRAQKMEAMGLMAGGVAHDLNNILSGIAGYPELMLITLDEDSQLRKPLESIRESGLRAAAVVADLLTVARSVANVREVHDLHVLTKEYLNSPECWQFRSLFPQISVEFESNVTGAIILCSPIHIKKCLMNLVTNGLEAIEGNGRVVVKVSEQTVSESFDGDVFSEYLVLSVYDSGLGISEEDRRHIFEPFYTKKVMGKSGTGLGLAVVWNTVQDHDGKIKIDSNGQGTTFNLFFPRHVEVALESRKEHEAISLMGMGEQILVVDDEPVLRDLAYQTLSSLGYQVDAVNSGEAALLFMERKKVDLVLLDMFMEPGINGCETYERIIMKYPGQKAIIVSGFSKSDDVKKAMQLGVGSFIEKPYSIEQLGRAIKELLWSTHLREDKPENEG